MASACPPCSASCNVTVDASGRTPSQAKVQPSSLLFRRRSSSGRQQPQFLGPCGRAVLRRGAAAVYQAAPVRRAPGTTTSILLRQILIGVIDRLAHRLARLEVRHQLFRNHHRPARARIAPHARWTPIDRKAAEASNLNALFACQGMGHRGQDGCHRELCIAMGQLAETFGQLGHEFGAGQCGRIRGKYRLSPASTNCSLVNSPLMQCATKASVSKIKKMLFLLPRLWPNSNFSFRWARS